MSYNWPADHQSVSWILESSSLLKSLEGSYRLAPKGSSTEVTYELAVDLAIPMIGMLKRKAERRLIDGALKDLRAPPRTKSSRTRSTARSHEHVFEMRVPNPRGQLQMNRTRTVCWSDPRTTPDA
ncbi:SRPBCC family protein [Actinomadura welshii]